MAIPCKSMSIPIIAMILNMSDASRRKKRKPRPKSLINDGFPKSISVY